MDRSQKLTNPFVSETTESTCDCIRICIIVSDLIEIIVIRQHKDDARGLQFWKRSKAGLNLEFPFH